MEHDATLGRVLTLMQRVLRQGSPRKPSRTHYQSFDAILTNGCLNELKTLADRSSFAPGDIHLKAMHVLELCSDDAVFLKSITSRGKRFLKQHQRLDDTGGGRETIHHHNGLGKSPSERSRRPSALWHKVSKEFKSMSAFKGVLHMNTKPLLFLIHETLLEIEHSPNFDKAIKTKNMNVLGYAISSVSLLCGLATREEGGGVASKFFKGECRAKAPQARALRPAKPQCAILSSPQPVSTLVNLLCAADSADDGSLFGDLLSR